MLITTIYFLNGYRTKWIHVEMKFLTSVLVAEWKPIQELLDFNYIYNILQQEFCWTVLDV